MELHHIAGFAQSSEGQRFASGLKYRFAAAHKTFAKPAPLAAVPKSATYQ
jgi:hypothetical protein